MTSSTSVIKATEFIESGPRDWFISDHHFGHSNIIKHAKRPFVDVMQMDRAMIEMWNSRVRHEDRVIHLGDLYWGSESRKWLSIRHRLNGRILLVPGNHDPAQDLLDSGAVDEVLPPVVETLYRCIRTGVKRYFVMCHYPFAEWHRMWGGAIHLHGHTHGNPPAGHKTSGNLRRLDLSADAVGFTPLAPQEIIDRFPI